jgi:hypothetical protein
MAPKRAALALALGIALLILITYRSPDITAAVQKGFVLDLDAPDFPYEEGAFNDTEASKEHDYNGSGNVTYWVKIPRNSTVTSASLNVTGKITTIYTVQITTSGLQGFSIGNCTQDLANEISTGTKGSDGTVRLRYGTNGSSIWETQVSVNKQIYSSFIGNITDDAGSEVAVGSEEGKLYLLDSSGSEIWNYTTGGMVRAAVIGDVYESGDSFVATGAGSTIYVINSTGGLNWSKSVGNTVYGISIGNITTGIGNEIVAACDSGNMYVLNSSGSVVNNTVIGSLALNSVSVGNVTGDLGNEIAIGSADGKAYLLNSSYKQIWNFTTQGSINSIRIDDVTSEYLGNEIVCGSNDKKVYTLDNTGGLIWDFEADDYINTIAIGNITADDGNEVAAGAANGYIYTFNFDYFPTNLSIDAGDNGTYEWNYSGPLRDTEVASGLEGGLQHHIDNDCATDVCDVPVLFHSDMPGRLEVYELNVTYSYNASSMVNYTLLPGIWSRTVNIMVNESVGNEVKNVSFLANPDQDIGVYYIKISGAAERCDFNGSAYQNLTVGQDNVCNVPDFTIPSSGNLPQPFHFWDDSMGSGVPVKGNESGYSYTNETDNFISSKSVMVWNDTSTVFYNITANTTVDDPSIRDMLFLNVTWLGQQCDITPQQEHAACDSGSPVYTQFTCSSDTFYVCRKGGFFRWIQPYANSLTGYEAGGSTNLHANLSDANVTLNVSPWGDWFNYSVFVNDTDGNYVNVTLWYWLEHEGSWFDGSAVNISGNGTAWFNMTSDSTWVGVNKYRFQYQDLNSSGEPMHSPMNTSIYWGPLARKHSTESVYVSGNESVVNRSGSVEIVTRINDTDNGTWVQGGVNCTLWVTYNGSEFDSGHANTTNSSGYCIFWFTPDGSYSAGNQSWKAGVLDDTYYNDSISGEFVLTVMGRVNVTLVEPDEYGILYRNSTNIFEARLLDQYGSDVNQSGFNCSFWFNNTYLNSSNTTGDGHCSIAWKPPCSYSRKDYIVNVSITEPNGSYSILDDMDWRDISLHDQLNVTVLEPQEYSIFHRGDSPGFNSSVNDTCLLCSPGDYSVNWSVKWKGRLELTVNKTGYEGGVFPVIINASYLEAHNIDIWEWDINYTRVLLDGTEVPSRVNAWNGSNKTAMNWSQSFFGNYSELVFLANQSGWENATYEVVYNSSDEQEGFGYLENGGFESGTPGPWRCIGETCGQRYCQCELRQEGTETNGSYSLYLSSDDTGGSPNVMGASLFTGWSLGQDRIKIRYKPTGEFISYGGDDPYIRVYAGQGMCELDNTTGAWQEVVCYNESFSSADWVNITVHDAGNGGAEEDACHVYVDYICLANSSGDCVNYHSGYPQLVSSLSESPINGSDNITWDIGIYEPVGLRKVVANASGSYFRSETENLYVYIYGWSNLSVGNISSTNCTFNDTWICKNNASMDVYCFVRDANTSERVGGHNMSFWSDGSCIGSNLTDMNGMALLHFVNSSDVEGNHTIVCNITGDSSAFYNATGNNSAEIYFNTSTGTTTATVELNLTPSAPAENLTRVFNRTYYLDINITNMGYESMYDVVVEINTSVTSAGLYAGAVSCPPIQSLERCDRTSVVNVTYLAAEGLKGIYVNVTWKNSDDSPGNESNSTSITVVNSTVLEITETWINYTMPRGGSAPAGNFTVMSFGNTNLVAVVFSESGNNASNISQWISYAPGSIAGIPHAGEQLVNITMTVPDNATEGLYMADISANASGSLCSPAGLCWDSLVLNLNVTMPDWSVPERELNKTIGLLAANGTVGTIQVINNKDANWTFNVSLCGNGTGYIKSPVSDFDLGSLSVFELEIYHNTSTSYAPGFYLANITITNKEDAVPHSINVSVSLSVINLSIDVLLPNQSNPTQPMEPGDILNITANATLSGSPIGGSMNWHVRVGGAACSNVKSFYNNSNQLWYINCTAPVIPGNPIYNDLNLTGHYTVDDVYLSVIEDNAVVYNDTTPPQINDIWTLNSDSEGNFDYTSAPSEIVVRADVSDNQAVNSSWAVLYHQDALVSNYSMHNISGSIWSFNFSSPIKVGDYRIVVYANDSSGNENDTSSLTMGYFDVYVPIDLNGTLLNKDGSPIESSFILYKNGSLWAIHSFTTNGSGGYSWVLHRRVYDMKMGFSGHEITLYGVDVNASAVSQWEVDEPDNLTNPIRLDTFDRNSGDTSNVYLPSGQPANPVVIEVIGMESNLSRTSNANLFRLNYTGLTEGVTEARFKVFRCSDWNISSRTCGDGDDAFSGPIDSTVDVANDRISFSTTGTSAYAVAEWWEEDGGDGDDDGNGGNGGSSSSRTTTTTTVSTTLPFTVTTSIGNIRIHPGENKTYLFSVRNKAAGNLTVSLDVQGLDEFIFPEKGLLEIPYNSSETIDIVVSVPDRMGTGTYTGSILVTGGGKTQEIPVTMTVSVEAKDLLSLNIDILTPNVNPGGKLRFEVELRNLGLPPGFNVSLVYAIREGESVRTVSELNESVLLEDYLIFTKLIGIGESNPVGQYYLEVWAYFSEGKSVKEVAVFNLSEPYWSSWEGRLILLVLSILGVGIISYYGWSRYRKWKLEKARYIFPMDYRKMPQGGRDSFWIGRIAETERKAWFNPDDLTTHLLIAGATGSGKSVSASVFVEEALDRNVPVIVFDPTAQWTGFVKALEDQNLMKYYGMFGMDPKSVRPFKGMIFEVADPQELLLDLRRGFKRYLEPGEVTVFTLDRLKPGQYDEAVNMIIDSLFGMSWEESATLKVIVVFDEVHRLLEKYGGKGGYVALEKAAREFRKWGIGIIMCSQVLADFKEAIAGNVLTEVQLNTKSIADIQKVEAKYGGEYARKISRQGVGIGMLQNPKYNDGKPYFVNFRPTWHNPHKISGKEMEIYKEFAGRLEKVESMIEQLRKAGKDTFDIELELKLARDKLKQGRFRMAQIYITSLEQHLRRG